MSLPNLATLSHKEVLTLCAQLENDLRVVKSFLVSHCQHNHPADCTCQKPTQTQAKEVLT